MGNQSKHHLLDVKGTMMLPVITKYQNIQLEILLPTILNRKISSIWMNLFIGVFDFINEINHLCMCAMPLRSTHIICSF